MFPALLWELKSKSGQVLTCTLLKATTKSWRLAVASGSLKVYTEIFSDEAPALAEADVLRTDYIVDGWTEVFRSAPP